MRKIWKYDIVGKHQLITMPGRAKIVHVGLDPHSVPCVWAEVDVGGPLQDVVVTIIGTGDLPVPEQLRHVGSFVDGAYVWHVYADDVKGR